MSKNNGLIEGIEQRIKRIGSFEDSVRDYINITRYQNDLIKDADNWSQICSSLDVIGDTLCSQKDYLNSEYPASHGLKYIFSFGLLQVLFVQQDAMRHLSEAFKVPFELPTRLKEIRSLRNATIGHPTKNKTKESTYYNYISRMTLGKSGFTLIRDFDQGNSESFDIEIYPMIDDQLEYIESRYKFLSEKLIEADRMHREKYKDNLLLNIFHSSMRYDFSKVVEGICSPCEVKTTFALSALSSIQEMYAKFEKSLLERGDLDEYTKRDLDEYNHALKKLEGYLKGNASGLTDSDARIYHFYIREQHNHFKEIAQEVDDDYHEKV